MRPILVLSLALLPATACVTEDLLVDRGDGVSTEPSLTRGISRLATSDLQPPGPGVSWQVAWATYEVPLPPEHSSLSDLAVFQLDNASMAVGERDVWVRFNVPAGLVGFDTSIELYGEELNEGDDSAIISTSADSPVHASGLCIRRDWTLECQLEYVDLSVNLAAVEAFWAERGDLNIGQRLTIASLFNADPLGSLFAEAGAF